MGTNPTINSLLVLATANSPVATSPGAAQPCVAVHTFPMAIVCLDSADELYITWDQSEFSANVGSKMRLLGREGFVAEECGWKRPRVFVLFIGHFSNRKLSLPGNSLSLFYLFFFKQMIIAGEVKFLFGYFAAC